jgi:uroporphyrinogen III methyltransferase / synthase
MAQKDCSLSGRTIVVTRPRDQAQETVKAIIECRGKPYLFPTIEIQPPRDLAVVEGFFKALRAKEADYVIFMSINGVQHVLSVAEKLGVEDEVKADLKNAFVIAVGPRTAQELEKNGVHVDLVPERYTSEAILERLQQLGLRNKTIYIPRTSEAPPELGERLREMGNRVEEIHVYHSQLPTDVGVASEFVKTLEESKLDAILFTSSLGVKNFVQILKSVISEEKLRNLMRKTVIVAIGPTTAKTLTDAALNVDVMPQEHTLNGALGALARYWNTKK